MYLSYVIYTYSTYNLSYFCFKRVLRVTFNYVIIFQWFSEFLYFRSKFFFSSITWNFFQIYTIRWYDLKYIHRISVDFELEYVYFRVRTGFCSRKILFSTFYYYKISDIFVTRTYLLFVALNFPRKNLIFFIDKTLLQNYAKPEQNSANDKRVLFHTVSLENFKYIFKEIYFIGV